MPGKKLSGGREQVPRSGFHPHGRLILILGFAVLLLFVKQVKTLGVVSVLFGDTSIEGSQDWDSAGTAEAFQVTVLPQLELEKTFFR